MTQHRIILFCHDATGLGHLRRISRIAQFLQGQYACLIVTGMAEVQWMVEPPCEYLKIPNWDSLSRVRAAKRGRKIWLNIPIEQSQKFRSELISAIGKAFDPTVIMVDYLPFGLRDELRSFLTNQRALKYLIHRGIVDLADSNVLFGEASVDFGKIYDRIVVMADELIVNVADEYQFTDEAKRKIVYAGYVNPAQLPVRNGEKLLLEDDRPIIVCACGGGLGGEMVFSACLEAAKELTSYSFHIVMGVHGTLSQISISEISENCKLYQVNTDLHLLHRSASLVITHGGYNSVTEAMSGGARILVWHIQGGDQDERLTFESRLSRIYPIKAVPANSNFVELIRTEVETSRLSHKPQISVNFNGLKAIEEMLQMDLAMKESVKKEER